MTESITLATIPGEELHVGKSNDEQTIAQYGKKQQFKRNFNVMSVVGMSSTIMMSWQGSIVNVQVSIFNGGPTGTIIAYPIVFLGVLTQTLVMAEMASMMPISGGQYNWVAILAPQRFSNLMSYLIGWMMFLAWQSNVAASAWVSSNIIVTIASVAHPSFEVKSWHPVLVFFAVILLDIAVNTFLGRVFPVLETMSFVLHVLEYFVLIVILVYLAPKQSTHAVFHNFINGGEFPNMVTSIMVGSVNLMFGFTGNDAAAHIAEEVKDASKSIPKGMIVNIFVYFVMGYTMLITFLYCVPVDDFISPTLLFPFITAFQNITHSVEAAVAITAMILVMTLSSNMAILATSSRMLWAFAREDGVPFSKYISRIHPGSKLPLYSIGVTATISIILAFIGLGSLTAFNALIGLAVSGFYLGFVISASLMLWRRLVSPSMPWGPFRLGRAGVPLTIVALIYSIVAIVLCFFPPVSYVTYQTFNWSVVVFVGVAALAMVNWILGARKTYTGPKMEVESQRHWLELFH